MVAIVRAVASGSSILLLDEHAAGLDAAETAELELLIGDLATRWRLAVVLIEHDVALVMSVADRIVALDFGRVIASGSPAEVRASDAVRDAYLGSGAPSHLDGEPVGAPT